MLADAQRNRYVHQQMNHSQTTNSAQACGAQVASEAPTQPQYQQIKLALDVHAASIVVGRMIDGAKPQPPQTFKPAAFLARSQPAILSLPLVVRSPRCDTVRV
jgi:hypothetical protein